MKHYSERVVQYQFPHDIYDLDSGIPHPNDKKNYVIKNHSHTGRFKEELLTMDLVKCDPYCIYGSIIVMDIDKIILNILLQHISNIMPILFIA